MEFTFEKLLNSGLHGVESVNAAISNPLLNVLLDTASDAIVVLEQDGSLLYANQPAQTLLALGNQLQNCNFFQFVADARHIGTSVELNEAIAVFLNKGQIDQALADGALEINRTFVPMQFYPVEIDSQTRWYLLRLRKLESENEENFRILTENAAQGVLVGTLDGVHVFANKYIHQMLGYDYGELLGTSVKDVIYPSHYQQVLDNFKKRMHGEDSPSQYETLFITKNGKALEVEVSAAATRWQGQAAGMVFVRDISERKRVERDLKQHQEHLQELVKEQTASLEASNKELETFSYSVSHDLRAPLRSINGFCKILIQDYASSLDAEGRGYLERIEKASVKLGQLIDDILVLSRVTRHEVKRIDIDLGLIAEEIVAMLVDALTDSEEPDKRKVEFQIKKNVFVKGDEHLMRVALQNLLENAFKYTSKKPLSHIEFGSMEKDGQQIFFVKDDGAGFDMCYANRLFRAFERLHRMEDFEGTGIGLATVDRIIRKHGGRTWAEGEINQGATVYFTLDSNTDKTASLPTGDPVS